MIGVIDMLRIMVVTRDYLKIISPVHPLLCYVPYRGSVVPDKSHGYFLAIPTIYYEFVFSICFLWSTTLCIHLVLHDWFPRVFDVLVAQGLVLKYALAVQGQGLVHALVVSS